MKKKQHSKIYSVNSAIVSLCFMLLAIAYTYGIHKGLNTRITAGFEVDAANMGVALSRIWFGLFEGYVGYREVYNTLFRVLVPDFNPNNPENFYLLSSPQAIQHALDAVKAINPLTLPAFSVLTPEFISINMEDHGLADFYTIAFLLFGARPTSMYNLYFLLMLTSVLLFIFEYRQHLFPLILLCLMLASFQIFFFSPLFNPVTFPSVNSNRFISTLGFIPIAHIICMYFNGINKLRRPQVLRLIAQSMLFTFALTIRSSAQWQLITVIIYVIPVALIILWPQRKSLFNLHNLRLLTHPILASALILFSTSWIYLSIQNMALNPVYTTDCSPPQHGFWHSAFLGLSVHPQFSQFNPNAAGISDANGWKAFEKYMHGKGLDPVCHIHNGYAYGLHEIVIKQEFLRFAMKNKMFMLELYGYYKPKMIWDAFWFRIQQVSAPLLLSSFCLSIYFGVLLSYRNRHDRFTLNPIKLTAVVTLFCASSTIPSIFAYAAMSSPSDDLWMFVIYIYVCSTTLAYMLHSRFTARRLPYFQYEENPSTLK